MASLRPDPTFYPSAAMAMRAPPEQLAYVAVINPKMTGAPMRWRSST
jgi:selenium-binding protein 1